MPTLFLYLGIVIGWLLVGIAIVFICFLIRHFFYSDKTVSFAEDIKDYYFSDIQVTVVGTIIWPATLLITLLPLIFGDDFGAMGP